MSRRLFAVIPAAGKSRRMGQPKLLLPLGQQSVIAHLVHALSIQEIVETVVVVQPNDYALQREVESLPATLVVPDSPPSEMRQSVELGLNHLRKVHNPTEDDGWLLIPADHPYVSCEVLTHLMRRWEETTADVLVPAHQGRRGHPTLFRWSLQERIREIPAEHGLNWLLHRNNTVVEELSLDDPSLLWDMDTPEDYQRILSIWGELSPSDSESDSPSA